MVAAGNETATAHDRQEALKLGAHGFFALIHDQHVIIAANHEFGMHLTKGIGIDPGLILNQEGIKVS